MTFSHSPFQVYNSHSLRADCLMGEFKVSNDPAYLVMRTFLIEGLISQNTYLSDVLHVRDQQHDCLRGLPGSGQFPKRGISQLPHRSPHQGSLWIEQMEGCLTAASSAASSSAFTSGFRTPSTRPIVITLECEKKAKSGRESACFLSGSLELKDKYLDGSFPSSSAWKRLRLKRRSSCH